MKQLTLAFSLLLAGALQAQEPWIDITFESRNGNVKTVDRGPHAFPFVGHGSATGEDNALYSDGSGPVLELSEPKAMTFLQAPQSLIEFELNLDAAPSKANPLQLLTIGSRNSPGTAFGLALAGPDQLTVIRYAKGGWQSDAMVLNTPVPLFEWSRLAVSIEQEAGAESLVITAFLDGAEVGRLESGIPIGVVGKDAWVLVGGTETPHRSLKGQIRAFSITLDKTKPETMPDPASSMATSKASSAKLVPIEQRPTGTAATEVWAEELYPYRVELVLEQPTSGKVEIAFNQEQLEEALRRVCPDPVAWDSFAFEKFRLGTADGKAIPGGFKLVVDKRNLIRNGALQPSSGGSLTAWNGSLERVSFEPAKEILGQQRPALRIASGPVVNRTLSQGVPLKPGEHYLLSVLQRTDPVEEAQTHVQLVNPAKKLFLEAQRSYRKSFLLTPEWQRIETLHRPSFSHGEVRIFTGGNGEVADLSLRPCRWSLQLDLPEKTDRIFLYYTPRAGHRLPVPGPDLYAAGSPAATVAVAKLLPEMNPALRSGFRRDIAAGSKNVSLWQIPGDWPLRSGFLEAVAPAAPTEQPLQVTLPRGGRETVVLAINTGTPNVALTASLDGVEASVQRLCPIPVYDGPEAGGMWREEMDGTAKGPLPPPARKWLQDRYDAMAPLDFALAPPSREGIHPVSVTFTIPPGAEPGVHKGTLTLSATPPDDATATFTIPVELTIKGAMVKPMQHFLTSFGGQLISFKYRKGATFFEDQISVADYHGVKNLKPGDLALNVSVSTDPVEATSQPAILASRYFNRMLDSYLSPQTPMLFHAATYEIKPQGKGRAPLLENWDFSLYNRAARQYAVERDSPWLGIGHTNGHHMDRLTLRDGSIYSFKPPTAPNSAWRQVSKEEFTRLVGDYYEALAQNLDQLGVLDRAFLIIDESAASTYDDMTDYVRAMRSRPHAKRIRTVHTTYTPGLFRLRDESGKLKMEEIIDIPIPNQDEHFNFFERELHTLWEKPKSIMGYHVETDHMDLLNAGVSTAVIPLKFEHLGLDGWYCWASFVWSLPYPYRGPEYDGEKYISGPVGNPWVNPFYHHGPGVLSWFYPPDPRGPAAEFTDTIIPSYRLDLFADGILLRALLEIGEAGKDDAGVPLKVDPARLQEARQLMAALWSDNPVQWYPNPVVYRKLRQTLLEMLP